MRVLLFLVVAVLVNLPYANERWADHRVERDGVEVVAEVVSQRVAESGYLVDYRLPATIDPRRTTYAAAVDLATYDNAEATERLAVRVVPAEPDLNRPLGLVPSSLFRTIAIVADSVLLLIAVGAWYRRRRARMP